jgi:DNA topoisomerase IA
VATGASTLFIVESPTKAKKVQAFIGGDVDVFASYGHFRRLPRVAGAVKPNEGFRIQWEVQPGRQHVLDIIVAAARKAQTIILATDPDREGEAISWHMAEYLKVRTSGQHVADLFLLSCWIYPILNSWNTPCACTEQSTDGGGMPITQWCSR